MLLVPGSSFNDECCALNVAFEYLGPDAVQTGFIIRTADRLRSGVRRL